MKKIGDMEFYTFEEVKDELIGAVGTPERDKYEQDLQAEIHAYKVGEAIREARLAQHLTQEQLGAKIGVQRAQISRLEKGRSMSLFSMTRVFKALGISSASLELNGFGKVALW